jgi:hypothetical protein
MNEFIELNTADHFLLFFGSFYIILGFSAFFAQKSWEDFTDLFIDNDALSLVMGVLILPLSLFIIVIYNSWDSLSSIILMVTGYIMFAKSTVMLLRPQLIQNMLSRQFIRKWIWLDGLSGITLGLSMLIL